ncbi:MAG TPA: DNA/RNA non-specific endonuclease [Urbifossiella sp.]|jgi:endonuclease G|nr:DNA/RNA non-specific endonuclease [Urbifossiella sp.]
MSRDADSPIDKKTLWAIITVVVLAVLVLALILVLRERRQEQPQQPPAPAPGQGPGPEQLPFPGPTAPADTSVHLTLGNPSGATDDPANADNYLMRKPYFALSYNNGKGAPNWVSWALTASDLGSAPRVEFYPDTSLPNTFRHITPHDYAGSGFDRGHLCPHSDRASTPEASRATFEMTNMVPQAPHLNQQAWADMEDYCRSMVKRRPQALYIIAGPSGQGGEGSKGPAESIGKGRVVVPAKCWKVVLAVENGTGSADDLGRVNSGSRAIAVVMPNDQSVGHGWARYRTSVAEVEALTGYKFFDRVPQDIIKPLKARVDDETVTSPRRP